MAWPSYECPPFSWINRGFQVRHPKWLIQPEALSQKLPKNGALTLALWVERYTSRSGSVLISGEGRPAAVNPIIDWLAVLVLNQVIGATIVSVLNALFRSGKR